MGIGDGVAVVYGQVEVDDAVTPVLVYCVKRGSVVACGVGVAVDPCKSVTCGVGIGDGVAVVYGEVEVDDAVTPVLVG